MYRKIPHVFLAVALSFTLVAPLANAQPGFQRTIIVDPNGSPSANFTTIQGAINSVGSNPPNKTTILIYAATYNEVVTLDGTKENIDLVGVDRDAVIIDVNTNGHGVEITSGTETSRNNSIRNLTIRTTDGAGIKITKGGGGGDQVPADIILEGLTISADGAASRALNGPDSDRVQVINCDLTTDDGIGLYVDENWTIRDTTVRSFGSAKDGIGGTDGGDNARIINCTVDADNGDGIMPSGNGWFIQGTRVEALASARNGINVASKNDITVRDCDVAAGDTGVYVESGDNFQAFSSKFRGGEFGGVVTANSDNGLFQDCLLFGDGSILATSPSRIVGVMIGGDASNAPTVTFKGCKLMADDATDEVVGVDVSFANPAKLVDCEISARNTDTSSAKAYGVYSNIDDDLGAVLVGGVITSSSADTRPVDVYDLFAVDGSDMPFMSGTRLSKWNTAVKTAERQRPDTQRTINVAPGTTTAIHASINIGGSCTAPQNQPDVYRVLSVTGTSGVTGNVDITGTNWAGETICDRIALSGTTTAVGSKSFKTVTEICPPAGASGSFSVGTTNRLGLYHPISGASDVLQQGRKASAATSYTLQTVGTVHPRMHTVEVTTITSGDSFEWNYLATK